MAIEDLDRRVRQESQRDKDQALELLELMDMIAITHEPKAGNKRMVRLARPFVTSLRRALAGGGDHKSFGVPSEKQDPSITEQTLDNFAKTQWDNILYFVVGSVQPEGGKTREIAAGSRALLDLGGFVQLRGRTSNITEKGFDFLLRDINTQIWRLLIVYLENADGQGMDNIDILSFLFTLGSLEVGKGFSTANLTSSQLTTLDDLHDLGIVYRHPAGSPRFYPTRLATTLNSDSNASTTAIGGKLAIGGSSMSDKTGFVVVETNYRIYAYTNNDLRISILKLFAKLYQSFPNMVAGKLTKGSVQRAIKSGITAQQIISYLTAHAHPVMGAHGSGQPALPPTVVDQIRLWQIEGDRMKATPGYLFKDFVSASQYEACVEQAATVGVLVWKDDKRQIFFVTRFEQIKSILQNWGKGNSSANGI